MPWGKFLSIAPKVDIFQGFESSVIVETKFFIIILQKYFGLNVSKTLSSGAVLCWVLVDSWKVGNKSIERVTIRP